MSGTKTAYAPINLAEKLSQFTEHWSPRIVAELNGQYVKLAKVQGEFVWHDHAHEDELFLILHGELTLRFRDGEVTLRPGELYVVPSGVEHQPVAAEETHLMLFEPKATAHTGEVDDDKTVSVEDQAWI
ncbi:MAG: cupin domain-containing protein [Acidobacteriota bacterium]